MTKDGPQALPTFDMTVASTARIWNYRLLQIARTTRAFLADATRLLATEYVIRQFLDIGAERC